MDETVTVDQAISKGKRMINLPVGIIQLTVLLGSIFAAASGFIPGWFVVIGVFACVIIPWIYWSFMITRWRIWAFENVRNVHELKQRAIQEKLIWKDGSIFEKNRNQNAGG